MKKHLLFLLLLVAGNFANAQWCIPPASTCGLNYNVSFSTTGGITNISNPNTNCAGVGGYIYYNSMTHTSTLGGMVNFSFTNNNVFNEYYGIWIDWNQDFDFLDPGELVYGITSVSAGATVNGNFIVPITATPGTTRMRLRQHYVQATLDPCSYN